MLKYLTFLLLLSACEKFGIVSKHNSIKSVANQSKSKFAFASVVPANANECTNGGWKLVPLKEAGNLKSEVDIPQHVYSCVDPSGQIETQPSDQGSEILNDSSLPSEADEILSDEARQSLIGIYLEKCEHPEPSTSSLDKTFVTLRLLYPGTCAEFAEKIISLYNRGSLSLGQIKDVGEKNLQLDFFKSFAPHTIAITFSYGVFELNNSLSEFTLLSKISISGGPPNPDYWQFLPKNLRSLAIQDSDLSDVSPITRFTELEELILPNNKLADAMPLKSLPGIKKLVLKGNSIQNIGFLDSLSQIEYIDLSQNPIKSYLPLIQKIHINHQLEAFSDLQTLPRKVFIK